MKRFNFLKENSDDDSKIFWNFTLFSIQYFFCRNWLLVDWTEFSKLAANSVTKALTWRTTPNSLLVSSIWLTLIIMIWWTLRKIWFPEWSSPSMVATSCSIIRMVRKVQQLRSTLLRLSVAFTCSPNWRSAWAWNFQLLINWTLLELLNAWTSFASSTELNARHRARPRVSWIRYDVQYKIKILRN